MTGGSTITAWHGTVWRFDAFSEKWVGRGEANAQGWGFYFSEKRPGAEKIQRYLQFRERIPCGYVYRVDLSFDRHELVDLERPYPAQPEAIQRRLLRAFSTAAKRAVDRYSLCWLYQDLRRSEGKRAAAQRLRDAGLAGFQMYEDDNNYHHGRTIVMLEADRIAIRSREQWVEKSSIPGHWHFVETFRA